MHMKDRTIYLAYFALSLLQVVSQSSNVTSCTPLYQWSLNSKSQTPCLVAAFLESACEGPVTINALPFGNHYTGPDTLAEATRCRCSTVTYSLISACAGCQDRRFQNWTDWSAQCPEVEVGQFLQTVPPQVVVPAWAYLNVTKSNNTFNPILAQNNQSSEALSESAASSSSTSSGVISRNTDVITPPPPPAPSHKSNAGFFIQIPRDELESIISFTTSYDRAHPRPQCD
ncbi:hypothetical protein C8J57DRAFT_271225 [Mycena rebaudengoi]|nr:hypothetical protein C8J57DRAFT_271225 [Mycena rebaudengoi]